ncbi:MAG: SDR family NAD(P)-dependent oxidoreductase [Gammaproteobacteria bacterium]|nr:SDR family NAD(P)-dependent oxidoreductase [Gammaproteobacteria bacterium]
MKTEKLRAIVSGGASGLGRAVVERIIGNDGQAVILDLNREQGETAKHELGKAVHFITTDVSDEPSVASAVAGAKEMMEGIDLVVNCAGVLGVSRVLGRDGPMDGSLFQKVININLVGSFFLLRTAADLMQHNEPNEEGERGVVINTASVAAFEGQIGQAAYSASKAGVVGMTLPIAREFARIGIRVLTVAPGIFHTPMMGELSDDAQASLAEQVPFPKRLGKPEEFADLVMYGISNSMLNGTTIRLDGALRMQAK